MLVAGISPRFCDAMDGSTGISYNVQKLGGQSRMQSLWGRLRVFQKRGKRDGWDDPRLVLDAFCTWDASVCEAPVLPTNMIKRAYRLSRRHGASESTRLMHLDLA